MTAPRVGMEAFTNSAEMSACMVGKALHASPLSNPMLRTWNATVNGVPGHMPHDAHYIEFEGEFSEPTRKLFVAALKYCAGSKSTPVIMIRINSYGGNIYSLLPMLDAIEAVRLTPENPTGKKIYTLCSSHVMSCGAVLFSAGDVRIFNGKMSEMMVHPARVWVQGSQTNPALTSKAAQMDTLNNDLFAYMSKQYGIDMERWLREKGNNYELHIRPDVAADPAAHWDGQDFWLKGSKKAPMAITSTTDGVPCLNFQFSVTADLNITPPGVAAGGPTLEAAGASILMKRKHVPLTVDSVAPLHIVPEHIGSMVARTGALNLSWDATVV